MSENPTLFVVAGPNGVGKTTAFNELIPADVNYINADLIAQSIREKTVNANTQEIANQEAAAIFYEFVNKRVDFSIETNLYDLETYKSFIGIQRLGYRIEILFLCVDHPDVCNERIANRVKQGGHYVRPDIVKARYETGLKLLEHYFDQPDRLTLIDTTEGCLNVQAVLEKGIINMQGNIRPWAKPIIKAANHVKDVPLSPAKIREQYLKERKEKDSPHQS